MTDRGGDATSGREYYDDPAVVQRYADLRAESLFDREARAVETYFTPGGRVLDLGCGAGRTTVALEDRGFDVVAVDVSAPMVATAAAASGADCVVADAANLPFADAAFDDVLFSYNGLDELRPASARVDALLEVERVLRPGGRFAFSTHNWMRRVLPVPPTTDRLRDLWTFVARNARDGNLGSRYLWDVNDDADRRVYFADPPTQVCQLDATGFDVLALLGRSGAASKYLGASLFVVAETE